MGSTDSEISGIGADLYKWVKGSDQKRRGYTRLNAPLPAPRKRVRIARLGTKKLKSIRIKRIPRLRLRLRWFSPLALLAKLRDAYINLLNAASDKLGSSEGMAVGAFPAYPADFITSGAPSLDLKARDRELNKLIKLYLARTHQQLILPHED